MGRPRSRHWSGVDTVFSQENIKDRNYYKDITVDGRITLIGS
jgi:hypothetical protein